MSHTPTMPGALTFRHGVHPEEHKEATEARPIQRMPFVDEYVIHLGQHIGAPAKAVVKVGQSVQRGQLIAQASGFVSTNHHAPVTGKVIAIERRPHPSGKLEMAIVIRIDPFDSQEEILPVTQGPIPMEKRVEMIQKAGIVGMGGAAFPTHVKINVPKGKVRYVMLNGCECEPYLTCDHRLMLEDPNDVVSGLQWLMETVGAEYGYIGVEVNKMNAIRALQDVIRETTLSNVEVAPLQVKYPQGAEKSMIYSILKREVPSGKLPLELGVIVNNVATAAAIHRLNTLGHPLIERIVTVTGPGIGKPSNLIVPIGTPIKDVIDYCGGLDPHANQVILGGPMMGPAQKTLQVPVTKGTSGILALMPRVIHPEMPCIRCGRCLEACPAFLNPSRLSFLVRHQRVDMLQDYHMMDCVECGSCSFVCPSHIPLAQLMRMGKALVRQAKKSSP